MAEVTLKTDDNDEEVQITRTRAMNMVHIMRIVGETNPAGQSSYTPVQVKGAADVARKFRPAITVEGLKDEVDGEEVEVTQKVEYYRNVGSASQLLDRFHPDSVVTLARSARQAEHELGLLMRQRVHKAALDDMAAVIRESTQPGKQRDFEAVQKALPDLSAGLEAEIARMDAALAELEQKFGSKSYED